MTVQGEAGAPDPRDARVDPRAGRKANARMSARSRGPDLPRPRLHLVMGNYTAHKRTTFATCSWPTRIHIHITPTSGWGTYPADGRFQAVPT